jgi:colicin import membrane protein
MHGTKEGVMSTPAGWFPQEDGRQRYWDGELWTDRFKGAVTAETKALPLMKTEKPTTPRGRDFSKAALWGWGGLAFIVLMGALGSGFSGAVSALGLYGFVVGLIALARGQVGWARLGSRAAGGVALGAALVLMTVGGLASSSSTPTGFDSTTTSSDTPATTDAAAEAAAAQAAAAATAAAEAAATEAAATEAAAAAAEKAAAETAAQATADAAAAKVLADAAAAKATADAAAAKKAKSAAAARSQAAAAAAAASAAAAPPPPPPPAASVYYANCDAVRAAGAAPILRGQPGYSSKLDRDGDGIGCE